jgi:ERCC4-type nuclease
LRDKPSPPQLVVSATKPRGKPAKMLAALGIRIIPIKEDEGNVDRYVMSKRLAVERRTGATFLRGIKDKSLFTSAIYLREHFALPVLIVEGNVDYTYTRFGPEAVRGALSSMMLEYGVSVLSTPTPEETVALIAMMARQEQVGIPEISLIPKRRAADLPDMQRRLIEMLPGCGRVIARELLQRLGSVERILRATKEELRAVPGLGAKKTAEIHRVLNADYEAVDTEKNLEDAIEAAPELLFKQPVVLLGRQHGFTTGDARHIVDLVFHDPEANEVILVEAKRGALTREHYRQLRRYLDSAHQSRLLRRFLEQGTALRGLLVTVEQSALRTKDPSVSVSVVDTQKTIAVLKRLRAARASAAER